MEGGENPERLREESEDRPGLDSANDDFDPDEVDPDEADERSLNSRFNLRA